MPRLYPASDLKAGQVFTFWTIISLAERRKGHVYYCCLCACGKVKEVASGDLVAGKSKSCGKYCAKKGLPAKAHPLYLTWASMKGRCYTSTAEAFASYGGRGITICKEWRYDFWQFVADMGPRPPRHTLDRRDNDGNYCPENCRWATPVTQSNNRRNNRIFTINGETKTLADWVRLYGLNYDTVSNRIDVSNETIEKALTNCRRVQLYTIDGVSKTLVEWAELRGIQYTTVYMRMSRSKWTLEKALNEPLAVGRTKSKK